MYLKDYIDPVLMMDMVKEGYITVRPHGTERLSIANYTAKAQYESVWNDATIKARGLIFDTETGKVVARPFTKFFNIEQEPAHLIIAGDREPIRVQRKMDGSLGILYQEPESGQFSIATRGSFHSEQAIEATNILREKYPWFVPNAGFTYLFEIVYPSNRIVVDYGDTRDIILLDVINNETGRTALVAFSGIVPMPVVKHYGFTNMSEVLAQPETQNEEGFVVTFLNDQTRVKVKFEDYKRLHKILTNMSTKVIWEVLSCSDSLDEMLEIVPDEFYDWVRSEELKLNEEFSRINTEAAVKYQEVVGLPTRKDIALAIKDYEYKDLVFAMLDSKATAPMVWKKIEPKHAKPFWATDLQES